MAGAAVDDLPIQPKVEEIILPTYITDGPGEDEKFYPSRAKIITERILGEEIGEKIDSKWIEDWKEYGAEDIEVFTKNLADKIKYAVQEGLNLRRYKIVVQLTMGQRKDQGVRIASRCLWDTTTDNYASASFQNGSIWASAIVFGLYAE
eukprot:CAMPEP_0194271588 /NCGR_PEP_ID=MMETSP0169-20130528/5334_1 /TAXON_ID=218684 /ORGANISM="Corethron pennatum, Strain L29A3" /LENGTH=148 /DNA_ID=CAMNT_0039013967 /DNA_START=79 /DNA_END=525 /DNA_ORIENTATION=-